MWVWFFTWQTDFRVLLRDKSVKIAKVVWKVSYNEKINSVTGEPVIGAKSLEIQEWVES